MANNKLKKVNGDPIKYLTDGGMASGDIGTARDRSRFSNYKPVRGLGNPKRLMPTADPKVPIDEMPDMTSSQNTRIYNEGGEVGEEVFTSNNSNAGDPVSIYSNNGYKMGE